MNRIAYPLFVLLLMLALALAFHLMALTTSVGVHLPVLAPYITAVLVALFSVLNHHFYKTSQQAGNKRLMNYILISKITRMFFFLLIFLTYCLVCEKVKGFAVELVIMFLAYLVFDTIYLVRMQDEKKKVNHE